MTHNLVSLQAPLAVETGRPAFLGPLEAFLMNALDSPHSRRAYRRHVREAFALMELDSVAAVTPDSLVRYREVLLQDGRGDATHAQALSGLRSFLNWCSDMGGLSFPARTMERLLRVPSVEVNKPYVTASSAEIERVLDVASLRDKALVLVMAGGGLRVSEVSNLDCTDLLDVDGAPALWVRKGKGRKDRLVPVRDEVMEAIHRYLLASGRQVGDEGPLFLGEEKGAKKRGLHRLSDWGIRYALKRRVLAGDVAKRLPPHALRHTFGMEFQRNGKDMNMTAKVLGHRSLKPTMRYTDHLQLAEQREFLPSWVRSKVQ